MINDLDKHKHRRDKQGETQSLMNGLYKGGARPARWEKFLMVSTSSSLFVIFSFIIFNLTLNLSEGLLKLSECIIFQIS